MVGALVWTFIGTTTVPPVWSSVGVKEGVSVGRLDGFSVLKFLLFLLDFDDFEDLGDFGLFIIIRHFMISQSREARMWKCMRAAGAKNAQ